MFIVSLIRSDNNIPIPVDIFSTFNDVLDYSNKHFRKATEKFYKWDNGKLYLIGYYGEDIYRILVVEES